MIQFVLNDKVVETTVPPGMVVLDYIRRKEGLKGTKEGCREGDCGACTVLIGEVTPEGGVLYRTAASCLMPVGDLHGRHLVTIEGVTVDDALSPVQQALVDENATQCGFCTPGIVLALTGFLINCESVCEEEAFAAVEGNICRCTGYASIRRAAQLLVHNIGGLPVGIKKRIERLIEVDALPGFFLGVGETLNNIPVSDQKNVKHDGVSTVIAGGTDLFVQKADELLDQSPRLLSQEPELAGIHRDGDQIVVGAMTTVEQLRHSPELLDILPCWDEAMRLVSSTMVRNRATVGGNLVNASPIGDLSVMMLALDAKLILSDGENNEREIALDQFYHGYKQFDLNPGEIINRLAIPVPSVDRQFNFEKVSRRTYLDIASVNSAALFIVEGDCFVSARLAAGGVAPYPFFLSEASKLLTGKELGLEIVEEVLSVAMEEVSPISDVRGSADYKRRLLRRLLMVHFVECFPALQIERLLR